MSKNDLNGFYLEDKNVISFETFLESYFSKPLVKMKIFGEDRLVKFSPVLKTNRYSAKIGFPCLSCNPDFFVEASIMIDPGRNNRGTLLFGSYTAEELAHEQEDPGSYEARGFLFFSKGDPETDFAKLAKGNPEGLLSWPKPLGYEFLSVCGKEHSKNQNLLFYDLAKDLYILLNELIDSSKDISAQTRYISVISNTVLKDQNTRKSEKEIEVLYLEAKKMENRKELFLKKTAFFCLSTGKLPKPEDLVHEKMFNQIR